MPRGSLPWVIRFIARVDTVSNPPHWIWTGYCDDDGYGILSVNNHPTAATHLALALADRPLKPGQWALHTCDISACVWPLHLYPGDVVKNNRDRMVRKRHRSQPGETHPAHKLTEDDVRQIRALRGTTSQRALGERFGISQTQVSIIQRGRAWKHVT